MTRSDLRAEIARSGVYLYQLAAIAEVHPTILGRMLRGKGPFRADVADRVMAALHSLGGPQA